MKPTHEVAVCSDGVIGVRCVRRGGVGNPPSESRAGEGSLGHGREAGGEVLRTEDLISPLLQF